MVRPRVQCGVDIGTSTCQFAIYRDAVEPALAIGYRGRLESAGDLALSAADTFIPSRACLTGTGELLVGMDVPVAPYLELPSPKRFLINATSRAAVGPWPTRVTTPEDVLSALVSQVVSRGWACLEAFHGISLEEARNAEHLVSCPAHADSQYRKCLVRAFNAAGVRSVGFRSVYEEPLCAILAHSAHRPLEPGEYLVYDHGGGTMHAAWILVSGDDARGRSTTILGVVGDETIGGDTMDELAVGYFRQLEGVRTVYDRLSEEDTRRFGEEARSRLQAMASDEREPFVVRSEGLSVPFDPNELWEWVRTPIDFAHLLIRDELVPLVAKRTGRSIGATLSELKAVLLSGGVCMNPMVVKATRQLVSVDARLHNLSMREVGIAGESMGHDLADGTCWYLPAQTPPPPIELLTSVAIGCSRTRVQPESEFGNTMYHGWTVRVTFADRDLQVLSHRDCFVQYEPISTIGPQGTLPASGNHVPRLVRHIPSDRLDALRTGGGLNGLLDSFERFLARLEPAIATMLARSVPIPPSARAWRLEFVGDRDDELIAAVLLRHAAERVSEDDSRFPLQYVKGWYLLPPEVCPLELTLWYGPGGVHVALRTLGTPIPEEYYQHTDVDLPWEPKGYAKKRREAYDRMLEKQREWNRKRFIYEGKIKK